MSRIDDNLIIICWRFWMNLLYDYFIGLSSKKKGGMEDRWILFGNITTFCGVHSRLFGLGNGYHRSCCIVQGPGLPLLSSIVLFSLLWLNLLILSFLCLSPLILLCKFHDLSILPIQGCLGRRMCILRLSFVLELYLLWESG